MNDHLDAFETWLRSWGAAPGDRPAAPEAPVPGECLLVALPGY
jgi:hypothetical protein